MITRKRKIYICGDIDYDAYKNFSQALGKLEEISTEEIHIVLSSPGGNPECALAFFDRIRASTCPISITGVGLIASSAALILVSPKDSTLRTMTENSWVMVHESTIGESLKTTRVAKASRVIETAKALENQWNQLLEASTTTPANTWAELHKNETYLTAKDCLQLGMIGAIV